MQHFELQVSNGQSVGATTYVHDLDVDQTVNALRTLLRDKKYGIQGGGYGYMGP
jgi:DNA-binding winged helix-turn-helix (wHTH) protein